MPGNICREAEISYRVAAEFAGYGGILQTGASGARGGANRGDGKRMKTKTCLLAAAVAGVTAVIAGAIAAHGGAVDPAAAVQTAVRYHMYHALALLGVAALAAREPNASFAAPTVCFLAGIVLFSGGIYLRATIGPAVPALIVPAGGLAFIAGWLALGWCALRKGAS